jgi:general secretion pathway protein J
MRTTGAGRDGGFALIESIVVLALAALVLLTLLIASDLVTRNSSAAARRANMMESLATGLSALRQDLAGAKLIRIGASETGRLLFDGRSSSLGLAVGSDRSDLGRGDSLIWIETQSDQGETSLVRRSAPLLPQTRSFGEVAFANPAILLAGPWTYRFSYAAQESSLRWSGSWANPRKMPAAIRLEVFDSDGIRPMLPPLVVRLHIDADISCPDAGGEGCPDENSVEQATPTDEEGGDGSTL